MRHYKKQSKKEIIPGLSTLSLINAVLSNLESIMDGSWIAVKSVLFQKGTENHSSSHSETEAKDPDTDSTTKKPDEGILSGSEQVVERGIVDKVKQRVNEKIKNMKGSSDEPDSASDPSNEAQVAASTTPEPITNIPQMLLSSSPGRIYTEGRRVGKQRNEKGESWLSTIQAGSPSGLDRASSHSLEKTSSLSSLGSDSAYRPHSRSLSQRSSSTTSSLSSGLRAKRSLSTARSDSSNPSEYDSVSYSDSLSGYFDGHRGSREVLPFEVPSEPDEDSNEVEDSHPDDSVKRPKDKRFYDIPYLSKKSGELELIPPLPIPKEVAIPDLASWKERKKHKTILCLDGGGIRGIATTQFLLHLEQALGQNLSDVFDMVCGSSTGAILTALVGGLGKSAEEAHKIYTTRENLKGIFPTTTNWSLQGPKYGNGKGKTAVLSKYLAKKEIAESKTHILISTYDITNQEPCIFTKQSVDIKLIDAVNASSAAPTYFPPVEVSSGRWCIDGSIIASDLSICAFVEAIQLWGHDEDIRILSVGTGATHNTPLDGEEAKKFGVIGWFTKGDLLGTLMSSSLVQKQAEVLLGDHFVRVNSNCSDYFVKSELDNWSKPNLLNLQRMGQGWYKEYGARALDLVSKTTTDLKKGLK